VRPDCRQAGLGIAAWWRRCATMCHRLSALIGCSEKSEMRAHILLDALVMSEYNWVLWKQYERRSSDSSREIWTQATGDCTEIEAELDRTAPGDDSVYVRVSRQPVPRGRQHPGSITASASRAINGDPNRMFAAGDFDDVREGIQHADDRASLLRLFKSGAVERPRRRSFSGDQGCTGCGQGEATGGIERREVLSTPHERPSAPENTDGR